jgi:hypothetical protein
MPSVTVVGRHVQRSIYLMVCLLTLATGVARAQDAPPPAYIARVDGLATLERDGEVTPAAMNMPLIPGDRVRTTNGRVEIRFPDGTGIELVEESVVELVTPTRVRLLAGSLDRLEPLPEDAGAMSVSYLPEDLKMYGATFDQNGTWRYAPDVGYVWYPMVAADWRPYYQGYWEPVRSYGWTWIGSDVWSWPTHHYGRWGWSRGAWFWVPDRTFAAAWVSWGSAPGYVSWCPLGYDNRPVLALSIGRSDPWFGWTVVSRTHFGSHGSFAHRYAVEPRRLPRNTTFVARSTAPIAVPRHVSNGAAASAGVAVPRRENGERAGTLPPTTGQPLRAGTFESRRPAVEARPWTNDHGPFNRRATPNDPRPTTNDQRPTTNDRRAVPREGVPAPVVTAPPAPQPSRATESVTMPRAPTPPPHQPTAMLRAGSTPSSAGSPRASQPPPQAGPQAPPPPPHAAPQRSGSSDGHERAGATAQPRGGDNQPRGGNQSQGGTQSQGDGQRATARRRG